MSSYITAFALGVTLLLTAACAQTSHPLSAAPDATVAVQADQPMQQACVAPCRHRPSGLR